MQIIDYVNQGSAYESMSSKIQDTVLFMTCLKPKVCYAKLPGYECLVPNACCRKIYVTFEVDPPVA